MARTHGVRLGAHPRGEGPAGSRSVCRQLARPMIALLRPSMATQNDADGHDTDGTTVTPGMMLDGADQVVPLNVTALPSAAATQNNADGQDTDVAP